MNAFEELLAVVDDEGKVLIYSSESLEAFLSWATVVKGRNLVKTQVYAECYEVYREDED